ncbi:zinc finger protein 513-like, partial [Poeciliopsis prolifica]|uniref:zinc finger protein 513-like n=1 Tax=Poeciliopsis prolifica TaxID=188132 RepID=UPI0024144897
PGTLSHLLRQTSARRRPRPEGRRGSAPRPVAVSPLSPDAPVRTPAGRPRPVAPSRRRLRLQPLRPNCRQLGGAGAALQEALQERKEEEVEEQQDGWRIFGCSAFRLAFRQVEGPADCTTRHKEAELPDGRASPIGRPLNLPGPTANQKAACDPSSSAPSLTSLCQSGSSQVVSPIRNEEQVSLTCSLCHRKFSSKLTLRRHLGVHGAEKPFTCPHCPYSSRLKASLRQHLRTHTGEKPFRCAECPYASIDRSSLLRHSRTHSQVKPYRCQLCGYSSIQKKSLDLHARRHHTGEVFPCQLCEYSSPDRQLLLKHTRRRHAPSLIPAI